MEEEIPTRSQVVGDDVSALLRARNALLYVVTREEGRVEGYLREAAASAGYKTYTWDVAAGAQTMEGTSIGIGGTDPGDMLNAIRSKATSGVPERAVWIMRDLPAWLAPPIGMTPLRQLRNLARLLPNTPRDRAQAVIVITTSSALPPELAGHATVIDWPLPDRNEIADILDGLLEVQPDEIQKNAAPNGVRSAAIDAAVGLTGEEAAACYSKSLVQFKRINPIAVTNEKKRVIAREKVLEWYDPLPGGLENVGGLDVLKAWLTSRAASYSTAAREYGLPPPKGLMVVGIAGCGKSLISKCIATAWGVPLVRFDLGALRSKYVGESEANLRKAISVIEALGRCIVWLDEIEKAMQGATSGSADGGVSADALATILTWMQERKSESFVIATSNDISKLPPELYRKGRFDEIFWVDLPNVSEREAILLATLRTLKRDLKAKIDLNKVDPTKVAVACENFTGAEIASLVTDAMNVAFNDKARSINTNDLINAARLVVPLSTTAKAKIDELREWAKGKARPATSAEATDGRGKQSRRQLDL